MYKKFITNKLDVMKLVSATIFMEEKNGNLKGYLTTIPYNYKNTMPHLPKLLGQWRKKNPSLSASQFEITEENTTNWLDKLVLGREDRILFMIFDLKLCLVGHIGYSSFDFTNKSAEIDCVLRGVKTDEPVMTYALNALITWGINDLELNNIYLSTMKDNFKSIALYERCGFKILYDIPLFKHELPNGEIRWDEDKTKDPTKADKYGVYMQYIKETI